MGVSAGTAATLFAAIVFAVVAVPSSPAAGSEADQGGRLPCFHACFDQCVPRDEFWFCQFSCYHRCAGASYTGAATTTAPGHLDCAEQPCALSLCGQLRPGSKIMAACRDTCRKSYAVAACRGSARARVMTPLA
jgi:hypothetical protein